MNRAMSHITQNIFKKIHPKNTHTNVSSITSWCDSMNKWFDRHTFVPFAGGCIWISKNKQHNVSTITSWCDSMNKWFDRHTFVPFAGGCIWIPK
jgi:hypothetical protein